MNASVADTMNFDFTREELDFARQITRRARDLGVNTYQLEMDLLACHCNGNPLLFGKLADAAENDFLHDVCGIRGNIDRRTGELLNCFVPRCSVKEVASTNSEPHGGASS